jgi:hypothetical protein
VAHIEGAADHGVVTLPGHFENYLKSATRKNATARVRRVKGAIGYKGLLIAPVVAALFNLLWGKLAEALRPLEDVRRCDRPRVSAETKT